MPQMKAPVTAHATGPAQTVGRAVELLRLVASSHSRHLRLVDIAAMAGLDKSTAHRLLQRLVAERMLARDAGVRGYRLGPLLHELGLAAPPQNNLRELALPALRQLARTTGDMTFLVVRSGLETVCLHRTPGNFAIRTLSQSVGDRHPMGAGVGGLAIMAALPDAEVRAVARALAGPLRHYGMSERQLLERIAATRVRGYAVDEGTAARDVTAIGRAVHDRRRAPVAAVLLSLIHI